MQRKHLLTLIVLIALIGVLVWGAGMVEAQGPQASAPRAPKGNLLGTGFTYQGRLKYQGNYPTGSFDFEFRLYDQLNGGNQVGSLVSRDDVTVTNGVFTVLLDFGNVFDGTALALQVSARPGTSTSSYTVVGRQVLWAKPYALALPGLYTQPNDTSPNVIGGFRGNTVITDVVGGTIGGGGANGWTNGVTDDYGTVGGGYNNQVGDNAGTTSDRSYATVGGGYFNNAIGTKSTIGGGSSNNATNEGATVGGGSYNMAGARFVVVGGGDYNNASGERSTIAGGNSNQANSQYATVGGGWVNIASGTRSTIAGGGLNTASAENATIPGGREAMATHYGELAFASGSFASPGDAQTSLFLLRGTTTNSSTPTELFLDNINRRVTISETHALSFDVLVIAAADNGTIASYQYVGGIKRDASTNVSLVGSVVQVMAQENDPTWGVTVDADTTNNALRVRVVGASDRIIRWVATVRTVQTVMP